MDNPFYKSPLPVGPMPLVVKPWYDPRIHYAERIKWLNTDKMREMLAQNPQLEPLSGHVNPMVDGGDGQGTARDRTVASVAGCDPACSFGMSLSYASWPVSSRSARNGAGPPARRRRRRPGWQHR